MENVIKFRGKKDNVISDEEWYKEEVTEKIKELSDMVDNAGLTGFAVIGICDDKELGKGISTVFCGSIFDNVFLALGGIEYLKQRIMEEIE